jgi:hypothetical protein
MTNAYLEAQQHGLEPKELRMFMTIALILLVLWALGAFIIPVGGGLIHILLVIAVISLIWHFIAGRRTV